MRKNYDLHNAENIKTAEFVNVIIKMKKKIKKHIFWHNVDIRGNYCCGIDFLQCPKVYFFLCVYTYITKYRRWGSECFPIGIFK